MKAVALAMCSVRLGCGEPNNQALSQPARDSRADKRSVDKQPWDATEALPLEAGSDVNIELMLVRTNTSAKRSMRVSTRLVRPIENQAGITQSGPAVVESFGDDFQASLSFKVAEEVGEVWLQIRDSE